jgi:hypothetical protein
VTAWTEQRVIAIDAEFAQLAEWIEQGRGPISAPLAAFLPKLATGAVGRPATRAGHGGILSAQAFKTGVLNPATPGKA